MSQPASTRSAYQDQQATGVMTLRHEFDRTRDLACAELERDRDAAIESYAEILPDALDALSGEERRRLYGMLRLEVAPTPDGPEVCGALVTSDYVRQLRDGTGDPG